MTIYTVHGYENRDDYLQNLREDYNVPEDVFDTIAELYGPEEDFDGLVTFCEDWRGE